MRRFTSTFFAENAAYGRDDETAILIVGLPRSGTTLVEQILASHPQIAAAGSSRSGSIEPAHPGSSERRCPRRWRMNSLRNTSRFCGGSEVGPSGHGQGAVQLLAGTRSPAAAASTHHPLPAQPDRHLPFDAHPLFPEVMGFRLRPGDLVFYYRKYQRADGALARPVARRPLPRGGLRGTHRRPRAGDAAADRLLRPRMERRLPAPRAKGAHGENRQRLAGAPAGLPQFRSSAGATTSPGSANCASWHETSEGARARRRHASPRSGSDISGAPARALRLAAIPRRVNENAARSHRGDGDGEVRQGARRPDTPAPPQQAGEGGAPSSATWVLRGKPGGGLEARPQYPALEPGNSATRRAGSSLRGAAFAQVSAEAAREALRLASDGVRLVDEGRFDEAIALLNDRSSSIRA